MNENEAKLWFDSEKHRISKELEENHLKYWNSLKKFEKVSDIPALPGGIDEKTWKEFYCTKLIEAGAIQKKDLIDGKFYLGDHRRAVIAKWNSNKNEFEYNRIKFSSVFVDTCNHFEDDNGYALFVPIKEVTEEQFKNNKE